LVINPEQREVEALAATLSDLGLEWRGTRHAEEAAAACEEFDPGLVILSAVLPHANIPQVCRAIRDSARAKILVTSPIQSATLALQARHRWDIDEFVALPISAHKMGQLISYLLGDAERRPYLGDAGPLAARANGSVEVSTGSKKIPLQGDLRDVRVERLINLAIRKQFVGTLALGAGPTARQLVIADGRVLQMLSKYLDNRGLGDILVRQKQLDPTYLNSMLHEAARQGLRLGEMLLAQRMVGPSALAYALGQQVIEKLADVFGWEAGPYQFTKDSVTSVRDPLNLSLPRIAFQAARLYADPDRFEQWFGKWLGEPACLNHTAAIRPNMLELTAAEKRFLALLQGEKTLRRVLAESPLPPHQTKTLLTALIRLRMLTRTG
jgi:CheY-like chemotaxis protein